MNQQNKALFHEFPLTTVGDWEARIREDLKGADYEKKLIWKTLDNIKVKPYYTAEDLIDLPYLDNVPGQFPFVRGSKPFRNSWEVRQDFRVREVKDTVRKISLAVERGVTAPGFDFSNLQEPEFATFKLLLGSFVTLPVSLNFVPGPFAAEMAEYLLRLAEEMHVDPSDMRGSLGFDPLGHFSATGSFYASLEEDFKKADQLLLIGENEIPGFRLLAVNSTFLGGCGASVIQELAFGLSMASEYLTRLTGSGHSVKEVAERLQWNLGVGPDYFIEIAKIRAARLLFSALLSAYEADDAQKPAVFVHSITSLWNKTVFDPNVNMLRLTTEAMAAVLGGCDSLLVQPFDTCFREPNDFSERMARNIQIILREESYFDKVADPAAGSYYIDALTYAIAEHAWKLFLQTDEKGGYIKAFTEGFIRNEIHQTVIRRKDMISMRREILVGTNQYPSLNEQMPDHLDMAAVFSANDRVKETMVEPLISGRASRDFEELRLAVENRKEGRPKVFMLTIGNLAMRLARSQFSCNFFACAGYEVIDNLGFETVQEGVEAALRAKADIVVVCSSDDEYAQFAPEVLQHINGRSVVVVAGAPACMEELKSKGIHEFIHMRSNVLETLQHYHAKLNVQTF